MYVDRGELQKRLAQLLQGTNHVLIHGESGCGKSWLYKKTISELQGIFCVANLANASRLGSISAEFDQMLAHEGRVRRKGYSESKSADIGAGFAGAAITNEKEYEYIQRDSFFEILSLIREKAGGSPAFLVLDNLERVFESANIMSELADLITLLDDERYSSHKIKMIVVGVPSGVKKYFAETPSKTTIANRLSELPEVSRLSKDEGAQIVRKGLFQLLGYKSDNPDEIIDHVLWVTDRIPQCIHEYCLGLAQLSSKSEFVDASILDGADRLWLQNSLSNVHVTVERLMNERDTRVGRRNQVLYAIGKCELQEFRYNEIEQIVRAEFPNSTNGVQLNVVQMLAELAGNNGVIKRAPKNDCYAFIDPRYRMCIRTMLLKSGQEKITRREQA